MMTVLADELDHAMRSVADALDRLSATYHRLSALAAGPNPLPAPALTEQAIVDAMCADTQLAATVFSRFAADTTVSQKYALSAELSERSRRGDSHAGLQSLAVALAAASYRG